MKKVYFLRVYRRVDGHTTDYGKFPDGEEAVKLGNMALRAGAFKSLKKEEQVIQAVEDWSKERYIALKDGWMNVCEEKVYDTLEEYLGK